MRAEHQRRSRPVEALEGRLFFSSTFTPVPAHSAVVYDPQRSLLYLAADRGTLERYDVNARQRLEPLTVGFGATAMDITPDGAPLPLSGLISRRPGARNGSLTQ